VNAQFYENNRSAGTAKGRKATLKRNPALMPGYTWKAKTGKEVQGKSSKRRLIPGKGKLFGSIFRDEESGKLLIECL